MMEEVMPPREDEEDVCLDFAISIVILFAAGCNNNYWLLLSCCWGAAKMLLLLLRLEKALAASLG